MTLFNTCLIRDGNINCGNNCGNKRLDTFTLLCVCYVSYRIIMLSMTFSGDCNK